MFYLVDDIEKAKRDITQGMTELTIEELAGHIEYEKLCKPIILVKNDFHSILDYNKAMEKIEKLTTGKDVLVIDKGRYEIKNIKKVVIMEKRK
jgi:hypothetical protein